MLCMLLLCMLCIKFGRFGMGEKLSATPTVNKVARMQEKRGMVNSLWIDCAVTEQQVCQMLRVMKSSRSRSFSRAVCHSPGARHIFLARETKNTSLPHSSTMATATTKTIMTPQCSSQRESQSSTDYCFNAPRSVRQSQGDDTSRMVSDDNVNEKWR